MAEALTSRQQTAGIRDSMQGGLITLPSATARRSAEEPDLQSALAYLSGGGLHEVTTLTDACLRRGKAQVACDTDVMLVLCLLAAEALDARAPSGEGAAHG
ncbi:hypothetical protein [Xanthobacter aminoxidans]|uniref:hypothetical protein n=1 Tax=Xanthobacter aminoxidans TaxID=186280 RepID=UPI0037285B26